ncbi:unnamed protein product [Prorocentrum cordatum]|uniref:Uncharacterized protein n=1 Tax=Prorocentrum cordatum TaxID=2364126 RepID=A0ABN9XU81_9DINO|nr:unnamed protein product [Polarella glacialis]
MQRAAQEGRPPARRPEARRGRCAASRAAVVQATLPVRECVLHAVTAMDTEDVQSSLTAEGAREDTRHRRTLPKAALPPGTRRTRSPQPSSAASECRTMS